MQKPGPANPIPAHSHVFALPYAYGGPAVKGKIRLQKEDFVVRETLSVAATGAGEHLWLSIRKRGLNTVDVQKMVADFCGVKQHVVAYAGLKDRQAVCEQWFSVQLPLHKNLDWQQLNSASLTVLAAIRSARKLRRPCMQANQFSIIVKQVQGDFSRCEQLLKCIANGVPNYFGEQRFGHGDGNIVAAEHMFSQTLTVKNRFKRGLFISAARSLLFNRILAQRVVRKNWCMPVTGDVLMLDRSHSVFGIDSVDATIQQRAAAGDVHPTGPLYGVGESMAQQACRDLEQAVLDNHAVLVRGLANVGAKIQRRALRMRVDALHWQWSGDDTLCLNFSLERGGYATAVLREIVAYQ